MLSSKLFECASALCASVLVPLVLGSGPACGSTVNMPGLKYPSVTFTSLLQTEQVENPVLKSEVIGDWTKLNSTCQRLPYEGGREKNAGSLAELDIDPRGDIAGIVIFTLNASITAEQAALMNGARPENPAIVSINYVDGTSEVYESSPPKEMFSAPDAKPSSSFIEHQNGLLSVMITEDFINTHHAGKSFDLYQLDDIAGERPSYWIMLFMGGAMLFALLYGTWYKTAWRRT